MQFTHCQDIRQYLISSHSFLRHQTMSFPGEVGSPMARGCAQRWTVTMAVLCAGVLGVWAVVANTSPETNMATTGLPKCIAHEEQFVRGKYS
jgi:hypothetical protein